METEQLIAELLDRVASIVDKVAAYRLKILLQTMRAEYRQAVDTGLECLRLFGILMPVHPTQEQVQVEYEQIWRNLGGRSIESLIDLPLMTDPEMDAVMQVLSVVLSPAFSTDTRLFYLLVYQMANGSLSGCENGQTTVRRHSLTNMRWYRRSLLASKAGTRRRCGCTRRRSELRVGMASSRTKALVTSWLPASTSTGATRRSPMPTSERRVTAIFDGAHWAR